MTEDGNVDALQKNATLSFRIKVHVNAHCFCIILSEPMGKIRKISILHRLGFPPQLNCINLIPPFFVTPVCVFLPASPALIHVFFL